jgi:hypothetical protein
LKLAQPDEAAASVRLIRYILESRGMSQRLAAANLPFPRKPYRVEALCQTIDAAVQSARCGRHGLGSDCRGWREGDRTPRPEEP